MGAAAIGLLFLGLLLLLCEYPGRSPAPPGWGPVRGQSISAAALEAELTGRRGGGGHADILGKNQKCFKLTRDLPTIYIYNTAEQVVYVRHTETITREPKKGEKKARIVYTLPVMFKVKIMTLPRIAALPKMSFPSTSLMKF